MDKGDEVPRALHEETAASIRESVALIEQWHGRGNGRIRCCFAPRFAISCTRELLSEVSELARKHKVMIHTHSSENKNECEIVEAETGRRNVAYLDSLGISGAHVLLAHCIHLDTEEMEAVAHEDERRALSVFEFETRIGSGARRRDVGAQDTGFAGRGRRRLQQPPRHVYRDAHRGVAAKTCSRARSLVGCAGSAHGDDRWRAGSRSGK